MLRDTARSHNRDHLDVEFDRPASKLIAFLPNEVRAKERPNPLTLGLRRERIVCQAKMRAILRYGTPELPTPAVCQ